MESSQPSGQEMSPCRELRGETDPRQGRGIKRGVDKAPLPVRGGKSRFLIRREGAGEVGRGEEGNGVSLLGRCLALGAQLC